MNRNLSAAARTLVLSCFVLAVTASPAFAATIRYDIPPTTQYAVDNTQGIAKINYNGCVTQGELQTINFTTVIDGGNAGTAEYKVLQDPTDTGELPPGTFNPNPVTVTGAPSQSIATTLTFTLNQISASGTVFRFKLDPDEGIGLGEGPGVQVKIECVQPAPPVVVAGSTVTPIATVPVPTATAGLAAGPAPCISLRRVTLRAGVRTPVVVTVATAEGRVRHAFVRIIGPGIRRSGFTNARGVVTFLLKPARKGIIVIQSNICIGADRKAVLGQLAAPRTAVSPTRAGYTG